MDEMLLRELNYKIQVVIDYLKDNGGHDEKLYNHNPDEPDSDIVEYAEDVQYLINHYSENINKTEIEILPF
jgi:aryl-phospho-beta-D-glucosidase BglC (GH1 family)